jgi:hypothetical protein
MSVGTSRRKLIKISEQLHAWIHLAFGGLAFETMRLIDPVSAEGNSLLLILLAAVACYLPDIDHLFYIYGYGRKTEYSKTMRTFLRNHDLKGFINHTKHNHKNLTGIYSHNLGSIILVAFFSYWELIRRDNIFMATFFLSWTYHYLYDVIEDLVYFSKPNKNWFFIFNRKKV